MSDPTADKSFKPTEPLNSGDVWCEVNEHQPEFIDITLTAKCLTIDEARDLRDWLNKVLP